MQPHAPGKLGKRHMQALPYRNQIYVQCTTCVVESPYGIVERYLVYQRNPAGAKGNFHKFCAAAGRQGWGFSGGEKAGKRIFCQKKGGCAFLGDTGWPGQLTSGFPLHRWAVRPGQAASARCGGFAFFASSSLRCRIPVIFESCSPARRPGPYRPQTAVFAIRTPLLYICGTCVT